MFCSFRQSGRLAISLMLICGLVLVLACEKDTKEADKFPSSEEPIQMVAGELVTFQLANGITVYLQEEHSRPEVAMEVIYHAGILDEFEGKVQISRVLPHMLIFSPNAKYKEDGAVIELKKYGQVNGEITGALTHFDYIVNPDKLELALDVEVERLQSVIFTDEVLEKYAKKCAEDLNTMMTKPNLSLTKYGLMAFNQAYYYNKTSIPIEQGVFQLTTKDLERFHNNHYRPEGMVVVVVGDFDTEETKALIERKLGPLEWPPAGEPRIRKPADSDRRARWDIPAEVMVVTFPGPYGDERDRIALTLFGTFLNRELSINEDLQLQLKATYCSNHVYPVGEIPFFVFAELRRGRNIQDVRASLILSVDAAMQKVSQGMFKAMKSNLITFCESSMLNTPLSTGSVSHFQIIGQEALNIGMRHYLREGRTPEEFIEFVRSITFEEARESVSETLTMENMKVITITGAP